MKNKKQLLLTSAIVLTLSIACQKEKKPEDDNNTSSAKYAMGLRSLGAGTETADYLLLSNDLMSGEISSTGKGTELSGWNYYARAGNRILSMDYDLNECTGYDVVDGAVVNKGKFVFERMDCMNPGGDNNTIVAIAAPWGGGSFDCNIQLIDVNNISIKSSKKDPIYTSFNGTNRLNAWPTHSYVEGDKLFISFYPLDGVSWETPNTDTCYVSVFTYPGLDYIKTFKDTRTGPIGYYGSQPGMLKDEAGNHYTISTSSYAAGFTQSTKPSGILRINAGTDYFDDSYFFDVQTASGGYKLLTAVYVGNGKAVARVVTTETSDDAWAAFDLTNPICKIVVLDLIAKTVTNVADVPLHGGQYQTPFLVENGKVYMSINNGTEAYIYEINPADATAKKGAKIVGTELQSFFKL